MSKTYTANGTEKTAASSPTDTAAIHDNTAGEIAAITEKATPANADLLVIEDSADSNNKKRVQVGNLPAFDEVRLNVYNNSGVAITAGQVVYISGYNVGQALPEVDLADANNSAAMPAVGMADATINNGASGSVVSSGIIEGVSTVGWSVNDPVYVDTTPGGYVNTRPTVDAIQKIGQVLQVSASGKMLIVGAGRSNDVPIQPSFTDYTNANHDHADAAGGGVLPSSSIPDGSDATAIHDNVASEISAITEKASPVGADLILIEDSAAGNAKKRVQITNLPAGGEINDLTAAVTWANVPNANTPTCIHDDVSAEISALTEKASPVSGDHILIEDSAAANVKKRVQVGNLPAGTPADNSITNAKLADVPTDTFKGRTTAATGDPEDLTIAQAKTMLDLTGTNSGDEPAASDTVPGIVELAIASEVDAGSDDTRAVTPASLVNLQADVDANTAKPAGGAGTDTTAIHDDTADEILGITLKATPVSGDLLVIEDSAAAGVKKRITVGSLPAGSEVNDLASDGVQGIADDQIVVGSGASTAAYKTLPNGVVSYNTGTNVVAQGALADLSDVASKTGTGTEVVMSGSPAITTPTIASFSNSAHDHADAAGGGTLAAAAVPDGADATAIHDNQASEISAVTLKATPVSGDFLLIEDSAAANVKKRITIGSLPGGGTHPVNLASDVTGTLPVANGGTGQTSDQAAFDQLSPTTTKGDLVVHNNTANLTRLAAGSNGQVLVANSVDNEGVVWKDNKHQKSITIESPGSAENLTFFRTPYAITPTQVRAVLRGSATPSVTYQLKYSTSDRSAAGTNVHTSHTITSTTSGVNATGLASTIPANAWVWLVTTAQSGTVDELAVALEFTIDA
jgi:hypothetical protein